MIYFIVNPVAGNGSTKKAVPVIKNYMLGLGLKYKIIYTNYENHAGGLVQNAIKEGATKIIAVGGDGTIFEVLEGIYGTDIPFGILPLGTGNDGAKALKIPKNIIKALEIAINGKETKIDLINVNGKDFLNIASIGMDANIVVSSEKLKKTFRGFSYAAGLIQNIFTYKAINASLIIDGKEINDRFTLIAIANGKFYGGGFKIAPYSSFTNGLLHIVYIKKIPNLAMLFLFPFVLFGKHKFIEQVNMQDAKEFIIKTKKNYPLNIDGNIYNLASPLKFCVKEKAIKIMTSGDI